MATAQMDVVYGDLEAGSQRELMKLFVDGNLDKRLDKLTTACEFVQPAFGEQMEQLIIDFIKAVPLAAYDSGQFDGDRFLKWIEENKPLTEEHSDYLACQRARWQVELIGRANRLAHVRFQELRSLSGELVSELGENESLQIHLNPIRAWTKFFTTELIGGGDDELPIDVMVFPIGNETTTALFEDHGRRLIEELAAHSPCTLDTWAALSESATRDELIELSRDLADMGLVAFS
jgi:hypothetical protein